MAISREKKKELVAQYAEQLNHSEVIIISDYRGLTVPELQRLRTKIREAEGSFFIVKNTLARHALKEAGLPTLDNMLKGTIGISFCRHNVAGVAKAVTDFAKEKDIFTVKGGLMGRQVIDGAGVKQLADLPPLEVLRAQLLGVINAPASQLVGVVAGGIRQVINVLNAYAEKDTEPAAAEA